jgi:hypothetical protein
MSKRPASQNSGLRLRQGNQGEFAPTLRVGSGLAEKLPCPAAAAVLQSPLTVLGQFEPNAEMHFWPARGASAELAFRGAGAMQRLSNGLLTPSPGFCMTWVWICVVATPPPLAIRLLRAQTVTLHPHHLPELVEQFGFGVGDDERSLCWERLGGHNSTKFQPNGTKCQQNASPAGPPYAPFWLPNTC